MSQQKKLQMMTFIPKTTTIKVHTLGFPSAWKEKLLALTLAAKPSFNSELYMLPLCGLLGKLCSNWIYGLIEISNLRKNSDDSRWIVCLQEIDKHMCEEICVNLQAAALSYYGGKKIDEKVKAALDEFLTIIDDEELFHHVGQDDIQIIDENGKISNSYAYNGFCLKLMSSLIGKTIVLDGEPLTLNYSARNELMSQVLSTDNGDLYAYVFSFGLQTIPADSRPMLLLNCSRRRFKNNTKRSRKFLKNKMSVFVKHSNKAYYYKLGMDYSAERKGLDWDKADKKCYDYIYSNALPEAETVMNNIEGFNGAKCDPQILCVISPENSYESETRVGVGVGVKDEEAIYNSMFELISDIVDKSPQTAKAITKRPKLNPANELKDIRHCLSRTGYKDAVIEIYSYSKDLPFAQKIKNRIDEILSDSDNEVNFHIAIEIKALGENADPLPREDYAKEAKRSERIRFISNRLERLPNDVMAGSIIILPKNTSGEKDAKDLLRCGFAMANRVTQFFNPEDDEKKSDNGPERNRKKSDDKMDLKIKNTVLDLLRQFGYSKCPTQPKKFPMYPVIALGALTNLESMSGKKVHALTMMLKFNAEDRLITVESPALNNGIPLPYYKACLELCKLSMSRDCDGICNDSVRRYIEQKMKGLENLYRDKDAIVVVSGDGFIRNEIWPGISNKKISAYTFPKQYCPDLIDVGIRNMPLMMSLNKSKLRVVRMRSNDEVPDYYLVDDKKTSGNANGIYMYHDVFYASTAETSKDKSYRLGDKESSISNPKHNYREKRLIEYYPLRLCNDDEPTVIVNYLNELRGLSPQYNRVTNLPLPLHYLNALKEYFDFDPRK